MLTGFTVRKGRDGGRERGWEGGGRKGGGKESKRSRTMDTYDSTVLPSSLPSLPSFPPSLPPSLPPQLLAIKTSEEAWGSPDATKMFSFGKFVSLKGVGGNYSVWELALFLLIGCLGGLLGACFNRINESLTVWRMTHIQPSAARRCVEVLAVCGAMSFLSYVLPLCWTKCTPVPSLAAMNADGWTEQERVRKRIGTVLALAELVAACCPLMLYERRREGRGAIFLA